MKFHKTPIADVLLIEPQVFGDDRGFFMETWQALKFQAAGDDANFVQDNHSRSTQWTLRGMHLQVAHTQGKLVLVTSASADFLYKCTDIYSPPHERTLAWDDQTVGIKWPIPAGIQPNLSAKDIKGQSFAE